MKIALAILSVAAMAGTASAGDAIINGGFEDGSPDPWQGTLQVTSAEVHSGQYAALLLPGDSITQTFPPIAMRDLEDMYFWWKAVDVGPEEIAAYYSLHVTDGNGIQLAGAVPMRPWWGSDWEDGSVGPWSTPYWEVSGITIGCVYAGAVYVDDVHFVLVPEPATVLLLSGSALALCAFRRRSR